MRYSTGSTWDGSSGLRSNCSVLRCLRLPMSETHEIHSLHLRTLEQCSNMFKLCWLMILRSCANVPNIFKISRIRYGNPYLPTSNVEWRCGFSNPSPVHNHHSSQVELRPSCHGPRRGSYPDTTESLKCQRETRGNRLYYIIVDLHGVRTYWLYMIMLCIYAGIYFYLYIYICTYTHTHIHTYIHIYIFTYLHIYIYSYIHMYTYIHIYIFTYIHIHIFTFNVKWGLIIPPGLINHHCPKKNVI